MKHVYNTHMAEIRVSLPEGEGELVLEPGTNAITPEQYRSLRKVKVIENYFKVGFLRDDVGAPVVTAEAQSPDGKPPEPKPLERMNKEELIIKAREMNLPVGDEDTKAVLLKRIQDAAAAA